MVGGRGVSGGAADGLVECVCEVYGGGLGEGEKRGVTCRGAGVSKWRVVEESAGK